MTAFRTFRCSSPQRGSSEAGRVTTPESPYLVGLRLAGRKVVVVGGGNVAQRRLPLLIASGADVHVIARAATPAVEATATASRITLSLREYRDGDLAGAWYAIAATDDAHVNAAVVAEADRHRIFCVRADIAVEGSAVTPASFDYAGLSVGVLAGGEHRRSAAIRSAIREALQRGAITVEGSVSTDVVRGGVALIGGGPGDPELITVRGRRLLAQADVVVADRLAPPELLEELPPHVEVIDAAKIPYGRAMAQDAINDVMIERARAGRFVVRLKGGDPFVFARGYEEVLACVEAGIPVTVVPGVTSAIAVPASAGVPVTHRGLNHEFVVVSGHLAPGHPESLVNWDALAAMSGTIVLLMAVERIELFADVLLKGGRPADTPVLVVQQGTTSAEHTLRAILADVAEKVRSEGIRPPAIIVIGTVAAFGA
jgi:uroporphyrin-III C-methyltransferase / precorrin-2 dehydrogenase / sirohydrochlorin ferrochelatase